MKSFGQAWLSKLTSRSQVSSAQSGPHMLESGGLASTLLLNSSVPGAYQPSSLHPHQNDIVTSPTEDVCRYLQASFPFPQTLLRGMAASNVIISGSRALEFFVPGSCTEQSDWDFYVHGSAACVGRAINMLIDQGVVWESVWEPLAALSRAEQYEAVTLPRAYVDEYRTRLAEPDLQPPQGLRDEAHLLCEMYNGRSRPRNIRVGHHGHLKIAPKSRSAHHSYGTQDLHVITGHTTAGDEHLKVQLIFSRKLSPMQLVMSFYASHVQCAITPYGALHLYFEQAVQRRGIIWSKNSQAPWAAPAALAKWRGRDWVFEEQDEEEMQAHVIKQAQDSRGSGAKTLTFDVDLGLPCGLEYRRRKAFERLAWQELDGSTTLVPPPAVSKAVRSFKTIAEVLDFGNNTSTAVRHSLAFNIHLTGQHAYPDDVLDL